MKKDLDVLSNHLNSAENQPTAENNGINSRIYKTTPDNIKPLEKSAKMKNKIKKAELKFTKMIILSSIIFVAVRLFDLAQIILYRLTLIGLLDFNNVVLNLIRSINIIIIYLSYSSSFFIYFNFDRNFSNILIGYIVQPLKLFYN